LLTAALCWRAWRFINGLFGAWLVVAPWMLGGASACSKWNDVVAGAVLAFISLPRGKALVRCASRDRRIV
jgi:hypothetical protein